MKGLGPAIAQAGNYLGTAINSAATASSSQAAEGNWSFNNMQTNNVIGNKWDTNASFRDGQMTRQLSSGATSTVTNSGQEVVDISGAMSRLPISIKGSNAAVSSLQQSAKHAEVQAMNAQKMNQHAVNSSWNMLSQFHTQMAIAQPCRSKVIAVKVLIVKLPWIKFGVLPSRMAKRMG